MIHTRGLLLLCLGFVVSVVTACDDGPDAPPASSDPLASEVSTFEAFTQRAAASYCRASLPCCGRAGKQTQAECEAEIKEDIAKEIGGEGGTYSAEGGARCVAAIERLTCVGNDDDFERSCRDIMRGPDFHRKQGGETCLRESDCAAPAEGSATCDHGCDPGDASCTVGYCRAYVVVPAGAACDDYDKRLPLFRECGSDGFCLNGVCQAFPGDGEPCPNTTCRSGLECSAAGVCQPIVPGTCN